MHGGDVTLEAIRLKPEGRPSDYIMFPEPEDGKTISFLSAVIMVSKAGIATDPLLIGATHECGIFASLIISIFMLLFTQFSFHVYIRTWMMGEAYNYNEVWGLVIGERGSNICYLLVFFSYFYFSVACALEFWYDGSAFLLSIWPNVPSILLNKWFMIYGVSALTVFPCMFIRRFSGYVSIGYINLFAILVGMICVIVQFFRNDDGNGFDPDREIRWFSSDVMAMASCAGLFQSALFAHPVIPYALEQMENPTMGRCLAATWACNIVSLVIHYVTSVLAYLSCPTLEDDTNVFSYFNPLRPEVIIGKISSYIVSICSCSFFTYFLAKQVAGMLLPGSERHPMGMFISGLTVITAYLAVCMLTEEIQDAFSVISVICCSILVFILPAIFYLIQFRFSNKLWGIMSVILLVVGIPLSVLMVWVSLP